MQPLSCQIEFHLIFHLVKAIKRNRRRRRRREGTKSLALFAIIQSNAIKINHSSQTVSCVIIMTIIPDD